MPGALDHDQIIDQALEVGRGEVRGACAPAHGDEKLCGGHFVPEGVPLFTVSRKDRLTADRSVELRSAFVIGSMRTLQQDVEFGVLQIVDIALKAISPAVNDPSTAINCVDQLTRILIRWVGRAPPASLLSNPPHVVRVIIPWTDFDHLLDTAFEQIRHYAVNDIAVSLRLLRALGDLATTIGDEQMREQLVLRGRRIVAGCTTRIDASDMRHRRSRIHGTTVLRDRIRDKDKDPSFSAKQLQDLAFGVDGSPKIDEASL